MGFHSGFLITCLCLFGIASASVKLFKVLESESTAGISECQEKNTESCQRIQVDFAVVKQASQFMINAVIINPGITFKKTATIREDKKGASYQFKAPNGSSIVLTYSTESGYEALEASINIPSKGSYHVIENCGKDCHVLIKEGPQKTFPEEDIPDEDLSRRILTSPKSRMLLEQGRMDNTTVVTVTVTVLYTPAFNAVVSNIPLHMQGIIDRTHEGYINTNLPLRLSIRCIQPLNITEHPTSGTQRLTDIKNELSGCNLYRSSDITVVMMATTTTTTCGQVDVIEASTFLGNEALAWSALNCLLTFSHEVAHLFGARHDNHISPLDTFGRGYYLVGGPYGTIMARRASGITRINYFSTPDLTFSGLVLGTATRDNRRKLISTRFAMAALRDESTDCNCQIIAPCENVQSSYNCYCWSSQGHCSGEHAAYMAENCAATCNNCCGNAWGDDLCDEWAASNLCTSGFQASLIRSICRKACNQCS